MLAMRRLGRTARAGKSGQGLILLAPFEEQFIVREELRDLPLVRLERPPDLSTPVQSEVVSGGG